MILSQEMADTGRIGELVQPTMIMWGEKDEVLPYSHRNRFMRDLQDGYLVEVSALGHVPHEENPGFCLQSTVTISTQNSNLAYRIISLGISKPRLIVCI